VWRSKRRYKPVRPRVCRVRSSAAVACEMLDDSPRAWAGTGGRAGATLKEVRAATCWAMDALIGCAVKTDPAFPTHRDKSTDRAGDHHRLRSVARLVCWAPSRPHRVLGTTAQGGFAGCHAVPVDILHWFAQLLLVLQKNKNSVDRILKIRYGVERR
jgi:hypothetical protein